MKAIIAEFVPQAWVNDHAVNVDPEGVTQMVVTDALYEHYTFEEMKALKDDSYETDILKAYGPEWVREWSGPFYFRVEDSIREYFEYLANPQADPF